MARLRFAPSPTGLVHVGNLRTAIFNYLLSRQQGNTLILRIEDTDEERSEKAFEDKLIDGLKWTGIEWDEGPDVGGEFGPYRQSERKTTYLAYAERLLKSEHAYYCFCDKEAADSPAEQKGSGYPGTCRTLSASESKERVEKGEEAAIRLKIPRDETIVIEDLVRGTVSFDSNLLSDPVIMRRSGVPAYNFSVVVDDHLMKIDTVIRGEDHLSNTARQIILFNALGLKKPGFAHLSMVMGEDNTKLSKRHGSVSVSQFKEAGYLPQALFNYLTLLGWAPGDNRELFTVEELISVFSLDKVSKSAAVFDYQKLKWFNREHIRMMDDEQLAQFLLPFMGAFNLPEEPGSDLAEWLGSTAKILANYHPLLAEIADGFSQFVTFELETDLLDHVRDSEKGVAVIEAFYRKVNEAASPVEFGSVSDMLKQVQRELEVKGKHLYHPIRIALTGKERGIELHDFIPIIENGALLKNVGVLNMKARLERFLERLK